MVKTAPSYHPGGLVDPGRRSLLLALSGRASLSV